MAFLLIDDGLDEHDKVEHALDHDELDGLAAIGLWTLLCTTSARKLTDGRISKRAIAKLAPEHGRRLAELLELVGMLDEGGSQIHDYLDWNRSRADIEAARREKSEKGKKGAAKRWGSRGDNPDDGQGMAAAIAPGIPPGNGSGGASSNAQAVAGSVPNTCPTTTTNPTPIQRGGDAGASERARPPMELEVTNALLGAGFDRIDLERYGGAISQTLVELSPPADTDWFRVQTEIKRHLKEGTIRSATPHSCLKFVLNGVNGAPRLGRLPVGAGGRSPQVSDETAARLDEKYSRFA